MRCTLQRLHCGKSPQAILTEKSCHLLSPHSPSTVYVQPTERQYKPNHNAVLCENPLCKEASWPPGQDCKNPKHQCDYEIKYADNDQSMGALVIDVLPIKLTNGSVFRPKLVFGCVPPQS